MISYKTGLGNIKDVTIKTTHPQLNMDTLAFNEALNLFVGKNGTGKTFLLITTWVCTCVINYKIDAGSNPIDLKPIADFIAKNSFDDYQNIEGEIKCTYTTGASISITLSKGSVSSVIANLPSTVGITTMPVYMSSAMRLFDSIDLYLKVRSSINKTKETEVVEAMLGFYKLYDIMYVERLIARSPIKIDDEDRARLESYGIKGEFDSLNVNSTCSVIMIDGTQRELSSYSHGEQAVINLILGTKLTLM